MLFLGHAIGFGINDIEQLFSSLAPASFGDFEESCQIAHLTKLNDENRSIKRRNAAP